MEKIIKIWTRDSKLAIWQAEFVKNELEKIGQKSEIVFVKSEWDHNTTTPLYEMWIEWVFTRTLDIALLEGKIDIAVHSLKDVPTKLPKWIILAWIPKRWDYKDILIYKWDNDFEEEKNYIIWTSSLRRKAFLLNKFPEFKTENLRWNIEKRLEKIEKNTHWKWWIFAKTAIQRLWLEIKNSIDLNFMLPAPAQWALWIACLEKNKEIIKICKKINHKKTEICVKIERKFLSLLEWGCSMPIWTLAEIKNEKIFFSWTFLSVDWKEKYEVFIEEKIENYEKIAQKAYEKLIENKNAKKLIQDFKKSSIS